MSGAWPRKEMIGMQPELDTNEKLSVWVVEDDERFGGQLAEIINLSETFECEEVFRSCESALELLREGTPPDLLLMDIGLPGMSGIEGVREIKTIAPAVQVVILTVFEDAENIVRAIGAGASGYLHKGSSLEEIVDSLKSVLNGGAPINPHIARKDARHVCPALLTQRGVPPHSSRKGGPWFACRRPFKKTNCREAVCHISHR